MQLKLDYTLSIVKHTEARISVVFDGCTFYANTHYVAKHSPNTDDYMFQVHICLNMFWLHHFLV